MKTPNPPPPQKKNSCDLGSAQCQARKLEFHFGEAHQDPAKMKRMKPWVSTIHAGSGRAKNFDFLEAGKLQCLLPETWIFSEFFIAFPILLM